MRKLIHISTMLAIAAGIAACQPTGRVGVGVGSGNIGVNGGFGYGGIGIGVGTSFDVTEADALPLEAGPMVAWGGHFGGGV
ncbi:MAG: hypothetical protein RLO50_06135 [Azospirillaceae bacterium]